MVTCVSSVELHREGLPQEYVIFIGVLVNVVSSQSSGGVPKVINDTRYRYLHEVTFLGGVHVLGCIMCNVHYIEETPIQFIYNYCNKMAYDYVINHRRSWQNHHGRPIP